MEILQRAQALLNLFDNNQGGNRDFHRKIVVENILHIEGLVESAKSNSETDIKTRAVIYELLLKIKKHIQKGAENLEYTTKLEKIIISL